MAKQSSLEYSDFTEITDEDIDTQDLIKLVFLGDSGVGKTNIMSRFSSDVFNMNSKPTIGVDFAVKTIKFMNHYIKLQIWDTAGQERYRTFTSAYFKDAHGIIIVYDVTSRDSFNNIREWMKIAYDHIDKNKASLIFLGNKTDLTEERDVNFDEGVDIAKEYRAMFMEVSAFNNTTKNINKAFYMLVKDIVPKYEFLDEEIKDHDKDVKRNESQKINLKEGFNRDTDYHHSKRGCCM